MSKCAVDECAVAKSSQLSVALSDAAPTCHDRKVQRVFDTVDKVVSRNVRFANRAWLITEKFLT